MTIAAFDVDSYNKPGFNFATAWQEGFRAGYLKLGGDNLNPRYRGSGFQAQFNAFAAQPFQHRGCYWVTGGSDPAASARFYLASVDPRATFHVLDNEHLDDGRVWSDAEACIFFDILAATGLTNLFQYGSRDSLWNTHAWPGLEARGIKAIVAIYNNAPFQNIQPRTYPASLVKGHQYTSSASIGGLGAIDANVFTDDAFTGGTSTPSTGGSKMYINCAENGGKAVVTEEGKFVQFTEAVYGATLNESTVAAAKLFGGVDVSKREWDIIKQDAYNRSAAIAAGTPQVDQGAVVAAIKDALKSADVSVDASTVQAAVEAGLASQIQKIAAAVK